MNDVYTHLKTSCVGDIHFRHVKPHIYPEVFIELKNVPGIDFRNALKSLGLSQNFVDVRVVNDNVEDGVIIYFIVDTWIGNLEKADKLLGFIRNMIL